MSQFLCKSIVSRASSLVSIRNPNPNVSFLSLRLFSVSCEDSVKHSFVVSYLMNSFGFSLNKALVASKRVSFKNSDKPDKRIQFYKSYGFTDTQILRIVRTNPQILNYDTNKNILPKLEFLELKGLSVPEITKSVSVFSNILGFSLINQIIPAYDFFRDLLRSDRKTITAVKRRPNILGSNFKQVVCNVGVLREHGVPISGIAQVIRHWPRNFATSSKRVRRAVEEISKMGFKVSTTQFAVALKVSLGMRESTRQGKVDTYKEYGFSEEDVAKAFRRDPRFVEHSRGKITAVMSFLADEMSWSPSLVATYPTVLGLSLKKRIIPRCSVFKVLCKKGLVKSETKVNLGTLLASSEEIFLKKYVKPYEKEASELLKLYEGKLVCL